MVQKTLVRNLWYDPTRHRLGDAPYRISSPPQPSPPSLSPPLPPPSQTMNFAWAPGSLLRAPYFSSYLHPSLHTTISGSNCRRGIYYARHYCRWWGGGIIKMHNMYPWTVVSIPTWDWKSTEANQGKASGPKTFAQIKKYFSSESFLPYVFSSLCQYKRVNVYIEFCSETKSVVSIIEKFCSWFQYKCVNLQSFVPNLKVLFLISIQMCHARVLFRILEVCSIFRSILFLISILMCELTKFCSDLESFVPKLKVQFLY